MRISAAGLLAVAGLTLISCGSPGADNGAAEEITVFAAASLNEPFDALATEFENEHDMQVNLNFGGSSSLAEQINSGAPADIFAAADERTMSWVENTAGKPVVFASNSLVLVTPEDHSAGIDALADTIGTQLVVCAPEVPCGAAAQQAFEQAGVKLSPVSEENSVSDVYGKVLSGQADAGVVYRSTVQEDDPVHVVEAPQLSAVVNKYPIVQVSDDELAQEFMEFVLSDRGQQVLSDAGVGGR